MLTTITGQRSVTLDLPVEPTWATSNGQQLGTAKLTIPRNSAAWDSDVLAERGGSLVTIHTRFGDWQGITDTPKDSPIGRTVEAFHPSVWAKIRTVSPQRTFHGCTAGTIARRAVMDALIGLGSVPVTLGPIVYAPPVIAEFEFKRQTLLSVLTELSQRTGQQWTINAAMQFTWRNQLGRYREFTLVDDGRYLDRLQRTPLADQISETIEIEDSGRTFTARDGSVPGLWPSQEIVRV